MAVEETGMGRVDHKIRKHINAAENSPGAEDLKPEAKSGQNGLALNEYSPFGLIGNITPSTHPAPNMINNIIIQVVAGNTIVFNPHPSAKKVNADVIKKCNQYMVQAGAPENLVTCVKEPTLDSAKYMFNHNKVKLLSVSGGPAIVNLAMKAEKRVIAAGPGNPPVLIDETADLELAAREITESASYDNNILCTAEKEIFVVNQVFDDFMREFAKQGNKKLVGQQINVLAEKALTKKGDHYIISRDYVGKRASVLAQAIGKKISQDVPMLFGETDKNDPWVLAEQMTCFIPVVRVKDFDDGLECAIEAEHGFEHTTSIFTRDINRATKYIREMNCDIGVVNGATFKGDGGDLGESYFSHTIATPTGEGITSPKDFCRSRRIMLSGSMNFG
jgi:acyl-CoA reductase-like NAD-dependent aldehyde dehydrogenase